MYMWFLISSIHIETKMQFLVGLIHMKTDMWLIVLSIRIRMGLWFLISLIHIETNMQFLVGFIHTKADMWFIILLLIHITMGMWWFLISSIHIETNISSTKIEGCVWLLVSARKKPTRGWAQVPPKPNSLLFKGETLKQLQAFWFGPTFWGTFTPCYWELTNSEFKFFGM